MLDGGLRWDFLHAAGQLAEEFRKHAKSIGTHLVVISGGGSRQEAAWKRRCHTLVMGSEPVGRRVI
jgi:hypothetical protein